MPEKISSYQKGMSRATRAMSLPVPSVDGVLSLRAFSVSVSSKPHIPTLVRRVFILAHARTRDTRVFSPRYLERILLEILTKNQVFDNQRVIGLLVYKFFHFGVLK